MKALVQRVSSAEVSVEANKIVGKIGSGYLVLLGIKSDDSKLQATKLAEKLSKLRIMPDEKQKMNRSLLDAGGAVLVVSQFTLYGDTKKGNRPSFVRAAWPDKARELYNAFVEKLTSLGILVETGVFGEYMKINAVLDGPTTILLKT